MNSPGDPVDESDVSSPCRAAGGRSWLKRQWHRGLPLLILCGASVYLFGQGIGTYSLWDPWEPRYAQAMREMAQRGDFMQRTFSL